MVYFDVASFNQSWVSLFQILTWAVVVSQLREWLLLTGAFIFTVSCIFVLKTQKKRPRMSNTFVWLQGFQISETSCLMLTFHCAEASRATIQTFQWFCSSKAKSRLTISFCISRYNLPSMKTTILSNVTDYYLETILFKNYAKTPFTVRQHSMQFLIQLFNIWRVKHLFYHLKIFKNPRSQIHHSGLITML